MDQRTSNTRAAIKQCLTVLYLVVWCYCLLSRSTTMLPVFKEQVQVAPWLLSQAQEQCNSMLSSAFPAVLLELPRGAVTLTISISELGLWAVCAPWGLHLWNPTQSGDPSTRYCENGKPVLSLCVWVYLLLWYYCFLFSLLDFPIHFLMKLLDFHIIYSKEHPWKNEWLCFTCQQYQGVLEVFCYFHVCLESVYFSKRRFSRSWNWCRLKKSYIYQFLILSQLN